MTNFKILERNTLDGHVSFNELYKTYYDGFIRFANSYLHDLSMSEDLVAESFMAYWQVRDNLEANSNIRAYILTILKNKCLNFLKQKTYREGRLQNIGEVMQWDLQMRIATLNACNPHEIFSAEIQELLEKAIHQLPERTMRVFLMSRYEHKTNKEIAEILGISVKGVEFHMSKALHQLRIHFKDYLNILLLFI